MPKIVIVLVVVAVFFTCLLVAGGIGFAVWTSLGRASLQSADAQTTEDTTPMAKVEAKQLAKEFHDNSAAFRQKYEGRYVEVTGQVERVAEWGRLPVLQLRSYPTLHALFADPSALTSLVAGQKVRLIGKIERRSIIGMDMANCRFTDSPLEIPPPRPGR